MGNKARKRNFSEAHTQNTTKKAMLSSGDSQNTNESGRYSTSSSKTLGRLSQSPMNRRYFGVDGSPVKRKKWDKMTSSPVKKETRKEQSASEEEDGGSRVESSEGMSDLVEEQLKLTGHKLLAKVEKAHKLKEFLCRASLPGDEKQTVVLRVIIVATPTLRHFWDPTRKTKVNAATFESPEQPPREKASPVEILLQELPVSSLAELKKRVGVYIKAFGNRPSSSKKEFANSFDNTTGELQMHFRAWTLGGLTILNDQIQWRDIVLAAKQNEGLNGEARIFVTVGNGRLLSDGTVVEF